MTISTVLIEKFAPQVQSRKRWLEWFQFQWGGGLVVVGVDYVPFHRQSQQTVSVHHRRPGPVSMSREHHSSLVTWPWHRRPLQAVLGDCDPTPRSARYHHTSAPSHPVSCNIYTWLQSTYTYNITYNNSQVGREYFITFCNKPTSHNLPFIFVFLFWRTIS